MIGSQLVPARFLCLAAHLVVTVTILWSRVSSVHICQRLTYQNISSATSHSDMYTENMDYNHYVMRPILMMCIFFALWFCNVVRVFCASQFTHWVSQKLCVHFILHCWPLYSSLFSLSGSWISSEIQATTRACVCWHLYFSCFHLVS